MSTPCANVLSNVLLYIGGHTSLYRLQRNTIHCNDTHNEWLSCIAQPATLPGSKAKLKQTVSGWIPVYDHYLQFHSKMLHHQAKTPKQPHQPIEWMGS